MSLRLFLRVWVRQTATRRTGGRRAAGVMTAALALAWPLPALASAMQACLDQQFTCQSACADGACVSRCGEQAQRCMARATGGVRRSGADPGIKPYVPLPRQAVPVAPAAPAAPVAPALRSAPPVAAAPADGAERPPKKCIMLDTWSTPGVHFMVNRCAVDLSVSYCFTEGPFLNCGQARTGHVTVGALSQQTVKTGQGMFRFAYDFAGRNVSLCRASPASCGGRGGQAGPGGAGKTTAGGGPAPGAPSTAAGASGQPGGPTGWVDAASVDPRAPPPAKDQAWGAIAARQERVCRAYDAQGAPIRIPQHEIDQAVARGMAARKACFDQLCRYYDAQGREVDTSAIERLTWADQQRLGIDARRTACQRLN